MANPEKSNSQDMPAIRWRHNARTVVITHNTPVLPAEWGVAEGCASVMRRDGTHKVVRWLGFISHTCAAELHWAKPVKLRAFYISHEPAEEWMQWERVPQGKYVQGCLVDTGVYAVIENGCIRIV